MSPSRANFALALAAVEMLLRKGRLNDEDLGGEFPRHASC